MRTFIRFSRFILAVLVTALMAASCKKGLRTGNDVTANHDLTVRFNAVVDSEPLVFGDTYSNAWGEDYSVSAFRFYISHIRLLNTATGTSYDVNKDEYFLVNFANNSSAVLKLKAVPYQYDRISFLLGVDSIRNVSGAQTGALDPANGMFWTWNSGYIMAKLEGNSPSSAQVNNKFEYHIGGFSGPDNVLKQLFLPFPGGQNVAMQPGKATELSISANVNTWFSNPNDIRLSVNPVCMTPGTLARQVAENYFKMFTITNIVSQ